MDIQTVPNKRAAPTEPIQFPGIAGTIGSKVAFCLLLAFASLCAGLTVSFAAGPAQGKSYVLLQNGNVFAGTLHRIGDVIQLTREGGSTIQLDADLVVATVDSLDELVAVRRASRDDSDLQRIQMDVRWFLRQNLIHAAGEDALAARAIDPTNPVTLQLLGTIAHQFRMKSSRQNGTPTSLPDETTPEETEAGQPIPIGPVDDGLTEHPEFEERWLNQFRTRVQPILMNRCSGCHAGPDQFGKNSDSKFQLHSTVSSRKATRSVAIKNLSSVRGYINPSHPLSSKLRERALDGHGGRRSSLQSGSQAMVRTLDAWLAQTPSTELVANAEDPAVGQSVDHSGLAPTSSSPFLTPIGEQITANGERVAERPASPIARTSWTEPTSDRKEKLKTRRMPAVSNPFDPELFNRRFHGSGMARETLKQ